jgi:hypothetical protein
MTTATAAFLQTHDSAEVAYILWIDGLGLGYTTHDDIEGLSAAWLEATGGAFGVPGDLNPGLRLEGAIERSLRMFDPKVEPSPQTFSISDDDGSLTKKVLGVARPGIRSTFLAQTMDADATTMHVVDASQHPGLPVVYVGLETMGTLDVDYDANTFTVTRGQWSLFPKVGTLTWARTHEVDADEIEDGPEVTSEPVKWLNRPVGLYVCVKVGGVWSAGFPGTADNDAELLWAGRIKHWGRNEDGFLWLECLEINEVLKTSIGTRVYEGTLTEGMFLRAVDTECRIRVRFVEVDAVSGLALDSWGGPTYIGQLDGLSATVVSHAEAATAINTELTTALTGANDGVYAPAGMVGEISLESDGRYHLFYTWDTAPDDDGVSYIQGEAELWLSPWVWTLLGFGGDQRDARRPGQLTGGSIARVKATREDDLETIWRIVAEGLPKRFMIAFDTDDTAGAQPDGNDGSRLTIDGVSGSFALQAESSLPGYGTARAFGDGAVGFLGLGGQKFVAVEPLGLDTFAIRGVVGPDFKRGHDGGNVLSGNNELSEFLWADDDGGPSIAVRQVWIEETTVSTAMLSILSSTGTAGYNVPLYDVLPIGMGVAFPAPLMDVASVIALGVMPYMLTVLQPTPFTKLLESILSVLGRHLVWKDGAFSIVDPINGTDTAVILDEGNKAKLVSDGESNSFDEPVAEVTSSEGNPDGIINRISLRFGQMLDGKWRSQRNVHAKRSQSEYGDNKAKVIDGWGLQADAAAYWLENVASAAVAYYSEPVVECQRSIDFSLWTKPYLGCPVLVTDDTMIDPATGELGVVDLAAWVTSLTIDPWSGVGLVSFVFQPRGV